MQQGMTIKLNDEYPVQAFTEVEWLNDERVFKSAKTLDDATVVIIGKVDTPFKYIKQERYGKKERKVVVAEPPHTLWSCLQGGKEIFIANLDMLLDGKDYEDLSREFNG